MKVFLVGANGAMGRTILSMKESASVVAGFAREEGTIDGVKIYNQFSQVDEAFDVVIDFSNKSLVDETIDFAVKNKVPLIEATTGLEEATLEKLREASEKIPIVYGRNYSLGMNAMMALVEAATKMLAEFDIEIIEAHHNQKKDAPSGTALMLLDAVKNQREVEAIYDRRELHNSREKGTVGIASLRGGTIVGDHTVLFAGDDEVLEIKHRAASKKIFAKGAIKAGHYAMGKKPGLYRVKDVLEAGEQND